MRVFVHGLTDGFVDGMLAGRLKVSVGDAI